MELFAKHLNGDVAKPVAIFLEKIIISSIIIDGASKYNKLQEGDAFGKFNMVNLELVTFHWW